MIWAQIIILLIYFIVFVLAIYLRLYNRNKFKLVGLWVALASDTVLLVLTGFWLAGFKIAGYYAATGFVGLEIGIIVMLIGKILER